MRLLLLTSVLLCAFSRIAVALDPEPDAAFVRIVDVGAGLCCVAAVPGADRTHYMICDAGNWADGGATAVAGIGELIPAGSVIDLLVISHSDADHLKAAPFICSNYHVHRVMRPRYDRTTSETFGDSNTVAWKQADAAIRGEVRQNFASSLPTVDYTLDRYAFPTGVDLAIGDATVTAVFGLHVPPPEWGFETASQKSKRRNAGSIVVKLSFAGKSVLFTGDTVGRKDGSAVDAIIAAEKAMVEGGVQLDSDVVVAPHHGADNGSSLPFIEAIDPEFVIFSAGHDHEHPRAVTAERYLEHGVELAKMFRTDLGDSEGGDEWDEGSTGITDPAGDDDVDVLIRSDGELLVEYRNAPSPTPGPVFGPSFALPSPRVTGRTADDRFDELLKSFTRGDQIAATEEERDAAAPPSAERATIIIQIENLTIENLNVQAP